MVWVLLLLAASLSEICRRAVIRARIMGGCFHHSRQLDEEGETVMYLVGEGHEHLGPGTSMVQFINWDQPHEDGMRGFAGLGCPGGCSCGGTCKKGLGLFDGGMDFSTWGWPEVAAVAVGGYMLTSMFFTTRRAARAVSDGVSSRVRRSRRKLGARISGS